MYSLGNILIQDAAAEFIFNCVPAVFTAIRLVGEAGEVVCLEASSGGHGKGVGGYTGAEVRTAGQGGVP